MPNTDHILVKAGHMVADVTSCMAVSAWHTNTIFQGLGNPC